MQIDKVPVKSLTMDPANVRTHDDKNMKAIKASLNRFGQQKPIVVDANGVVVAGNGTLAAADALGWREISTVSTELNGAEAIAYAIADNRTAELADWDDESLAKQLSALQLEADELLEAAGFSAEELAALVDEVTGITEGNTDADDVPDVPEVPTAQPGQIWRLGDHRLMCGDSASAEDVAALMDGVKINVAFTSPPYASQRKYDESSGFVPIHPDNYGEWFDSVQANVRKNLAEDGSWFVNIKEHCEDGQRSLYVKDLTLAHVREWGWLLVDEFCWQRGGVPGKWSNRFKNTWEPVFHFSKQKEIKLIHKNVLHYSEDVKHYRKDRKETHSGFVSGSNPSSSGFALPGNTIIAHSGSHQIDDREGVKHTATFPIGLPLFFVSAFSDPSDVVYDPFIGSGTTLIASEQTGRRCYGMEISPAYCDVILRRWEEFTGGTAEVLDG